MVADDGTKYWGRFGAAGLLAVDAERGVLLQHRVSWSHFGGTWGLPGGALHQGEDVVTGALREAGEEAGVPADAVRPRFTSVLDLGYWSYTTLVADVTTRFEPAIGDPESVALEWVPVDEVDARPLHPGFAAAWPRLRALLARRPVVVVDAANVVGSVPDGWWKDRVGATQRLLGRISALSRPGIPSTSLDLPEHTWFPEWTVVVEGQARAVTAADGVRIVRAPASGDDTIAATASDLVRAGHDVTVVTSDRGLAARVVEAAATVRGTRWLLDLLNDARPA